MTVLTVCAAPPDDWRDQLFTGAIMVVTQLAELQPFHTYVSGLLRETFAPAEPPASQSQLGTDFTGRIGPLRRRFASDERPRELIEPVLQRFGLDDRSTFLDRVTVRVLPSGPLADEHRDLALAAHRDTWSSNVYAQVNWWIPIYPMTAQRALAFYPRQWARNVPNTSAAWDLHELRRQRSDGDTSTTPVVPAPTVNLDPNDALIVVVQPGDLLLFSGAQLHATVPNTSGTPRFSVEVRSVALDDVRGGAGAPNMDGAAPRVAWEWFRRVGDGTSLASVVAGE